MHKKLLDDNITKYFNFLFSVFQLLKKKEEGNEAFNSGKYETAFRIYTKCTKLQNTDKIAMAQVYFNRAATQEKVSMYLVESKITLIH